MGVGIGVGPLVVAAVVTTPLDDVVLERHAVHGHKQHPQWELGLVALVGPESVRSGGDGHSGDGPAHHHPAEGEPVGCEDGLVEADQGSEVEGNEEGNIPPHDLQLVVLLLGQLPQVNDLVEVGCQEVLLGHVGQCGGLVGAHRLSDCGGCGHCVQVGRDGGSGMTGWAGSR